MADYKKLVKTEAQSLFDACLPEFQDDAGEFGARSDAPNFSKWLDAHKKLNEVVEKTVSGWSGKDFAWVQSNTRNQNKFGDPRSNAFGSFYSDLLQELKKLRKAKGL